MGGACVVEILVGGSGGSAQLGQLDDLMFGVHGGGGGGIGPTGDIKKHFATLGYGFCRFFSR